MNYSKEKVSFLKLEVFHIAFLLVTHCPGGQHSTGEICKTYPVVVHCVGL
jgi:hypothetical protein